MTQVVAPDEGHVFHNRLTHSLKVGQVARRIAENVRVSLHDEKDARLPDPEIAEAAGFAHDLGHPPFGHVAEKILDKEAVSRGLLDGYEGNAQTFRIICKLAVRSPKYLGLNLSRATLNACLKYPWFREVDGKRHRKWGVYSTERADFEFCRESFGDGLSIEAQCMEFADDIAYSIHDAEDFYRAGFVPLDRLAPVGQQRSDEAARFLRRTAQRKSLKPEKEAAFGAAFDAAMSACPVTEAYRGTRDQRAKLRAWASEQIQRFVNAIVPKVESGRVELSMPEAQEQAIWILQQLTWDYVILGPRLATQQVGLGRVISELFDTYFEAVEAGEWHVLPPRFADESYRADGELFANLNEQERNVRLVADVISSMTDREALAMHRRLHGLAPGSVLDPTVQ